MHKCGNIITFSNRIDQCEAKPARRLRSQQSHHERLERFYHLVFRCAGCFENDVLPTRTNGECRYRWKVLVENERTQACDWLHMLKRLPHLPEGVLPTSDQRAV